MAFSRDRYPPGPRRPPGFVFTTTLGPRRVLCPGDYAYFHYENQRYWCRVIAAVDQPHRTGTGRHVTRRRLVVQTQPE